MKLQLLIMLGLSAAVIVEGKRDINEYYLTNTGHCSVILIDNETQTRECKHTYEYIYSHIHLYTHSHTHTHTHTHTIINAKIHISLSFQDAASYHHQVNS